VLIGYRCSGKSAAGERLAARLDVPFVDTDALIRSRTGRTAKELVDAVGWEAFRDAEREAIASLTLTRGTVIALGGGAVLDQRNLAALQSHGTVVWLDADPATLASRMERDPGTGDGRPALGDGDDPIAEIAVVLDQRRPIYQAAADVTVDTSALNVDAVVSRLVGMML
jgi:shikimate kinase